MLACVHARAITAPRQCCAKNVLKRGRRGASLGNIWSGVVARAEGTGQGEKPVKYNTEFGYSRKDVLLICGGLLAFGLGLYYGLQAFGVEAGMAGSYTQLIVFLGMSIGWVGSYLYRVANKQMTYVKQLKDYEEAVMQKRLEELTEDELERMLNEGKSQGRGQ